MSWHRHAINLRADGLATVLGSMSRDPALLVALLVDLDSGMVLDACGPLARTGDPTTGATIGIEEMGAAHGELMRLALGTASAVADRVEPSVQACEVTVCLGVRRHLVLRRVPDPHGDRLALSVLIDGPARSLRRVRRRLGQVSTSALTAGPSVSLRPGHGPWMSDSPQPTGHPGPGRPQAASGPGDRSRSGAAGAVGPAVPRPRPGPVAFPGPHHAGLVGKRYEHGLDGAQRSPASPSALPPPTSTGG
ncbi:MAG TPA: hypothetical protein VGH89_35920 [Pseudonocardia sp.]